MRKRHVAVLGAGMGGLVAALELAHRGFDVTVVERGTRPGGKLRELSVNGRGIDAGPTVFTMRSVFEEIFNAAGTSLTDHLTLEPMAILARHAWDGEQRLDLHADLDRSAEAIGEFSGPQEARRYRRFCRRARQIFETLDTTFIRASRPNPVSLVQRVSQQGIGHLGRIKPFASLWRALGAEFRDPRLRQLFGRYATYMGSSPFAAPATLMLIAHVERIGVWTVDGGMFRIAEALCALAQDQGATFRFDTEVLQVMVSGDRVTGLALADGQTIEADAVIVNADPAALAGGLLGPAVTRAVPAVARSQRSLSALTWALEARTEGFPLVRHNVFFSADYASEFSDIFRHGRLPATPTVYVCAQDRGDREILTNATPERLFCLVNAPPNGDRHRFEQAEIEQCRERAFELLARCGLSVQPEHERVTTPEQFEQLFPGTGGALYGPASHGWMASFRRPGARTRLAGLYLAGGSTHPGAGIPMAALSGRQAAFALLQDTETNR